VILTKQMAYAHEHEVRAFFFQWPPDEYLGELDRLDEYEIPNGIPLRIELDRLINRVLVAPSQSDEFKSNVEALLGQAAERHGFRPKPVDWSQLRREPEFYRDPAEVIRRPVRDR